MPSIEPLPLAVAALAFAIACFVRGVIGLGLPTISIGLLSLVMAPAKAASLLIVPSAGGALRGRFSEKMFRRIFFWGLLLLRAHIASRAVV